VQIAKLSFDELKNQECLLDIDIAYYASCRTRWLDSRNPGRVDRYLNNYIKGRGTDPYGGDIATNRRRLQCYIDKELPGSRVDISTVSDGPSVMNPFSAVTDATAAVAFRERLATPLAAMLSDFTARHKLEQTKQQAAAISRAPTIRRSRRSCRLGQLPAPRRCHLRRVQGDRYRDDLWHGRRDRRWRVAPVATSLPSPRRDAVAP